MSQNQTSSESTSSSPATGDVTANTGPAAGPRRRGRFWRVVLLLCLALVGGIVGYLSVAPWYESVGGIQIKAYLTRILYTTEQNTVMPMYDTYVETQATILRSQRTILLAMEAPAWKAAVQKSRPHDLFAFTDSLKVTHPERSEVILISFRDRDPQLAPVAVKSVIEAYMRIAGENDTDSYTKKLQILEDRRATLTSQLKGLNDRTLAVANESGTDNPARKELQMRNLKAETESVQMKLDETKTRIDQLNVESLSPGRTTVLSNGDAPLRPVEDRRFMFAGMGAVGGLVLGFVINGLIAVFGRRRVRSR